MQVWEFPGRATKLPPLCSHSSDFTQPAVSLPRPAVTKSLILSVTIKTQIPLRRIADGDGSAKPGFTAVLHSQRGPGEKLYHRFLNHKFLYHPLLHTGRMTTSATQHLTGWSRIQNVFSHCHSWVGFCVTEVKQAQCFPQAHIKPCRGALPWQWVCLAAGRSHCSSAQLCQKGEEGLSPCGEKILAKSCFSL